MTFRTHIVHETEPRADTRVPPIVALFDCVDSSTIDCMNDLCLGSAAGCPFDAYKAITMHMQLDAVVPSELDLDVQQADLFITRIFLHTKVWQVSVSHSILAFGTPFIELLPEYPLTMLSKLVVGIRVFSDKAIRGNGLCLVSKKSSPDQLSVLTDGQSRKIAYVADTAEMVLRLPVRPPMPLGIGSEEACGLLVAEIRTMADRLASTRWMRVLTPALGVQSPSLVIIDA